MSREDMLDEFLKRETLQVTQKRNNQQNALIDASRLLADIINPDSKKLENPYRCSATWQVCCHIGEQLNITIPNVTPDELALHSDHLETFVRMTHVRKRNVKLSGKWWQEDHGPMFAYLKEDNRPVALLPAKRSRYRMYDPTTQNSITITEELSAMIQTDAWFIYRAFPDVPLTFTTLLKFSQKGMLSDWLRLVGSVVLIGLLSLFLPYALGQLLHIILLNSSNQLNWLITILIGSAIASACCQFIQCIAILRMQGIFDNTLQCALWDRLLKLPVPFFQKYGVGDLGVRAMGINQIRMAFTGTNLITILSTILVIFYFMFISFYSIYLSLLIMALMLLTCGITVWAGWKMLPYVRQEVHLSGKIMGQVLEFINGISKIQATTSQAFVFGKWAKEYAQAQKNTYQSQFILGSVKAFNSALPFIANLLFFLVFSHFFNGISITTTGPIFLAINAAFGSLIGLSLSFSCTILELINVVPIYERLAPILQTNPEIDEKKLDPGPLKGKIEVHGLYFRYNQSPANVLEDISLDIEPGEYVAIVGPSGNGKSTFLRLLLGFEEGQRGTIDYDGRSISTLDLISLRRQIGVVLQTSKLTTDTIYNNIAGSSNYTTEQVWDAIRLAGLEDTIKAMPMGLHTYVSGQSNILSGGEQQLLLIARALIGKPKLLFLDEATSCLDNHSQAIISNSLHALKATRIILAHRLSTVRKVDRIFVFKKGRLVESGTYEALLNKNGEFTELARRQLV